MRDQRKLKAAMILREEENSQLSAKLSVREGQLQRLADENGSACLSLQIVMV